MGEVKKINKRIKRVEVKIGIVMLNKLILNIEKKLLTKIYKI